MPKKQYKYTKEQHQAIKGLKQAIVEVFTVNDSPGMHKPALDLIQSASELFDGLVRDIAIKALRYKNISDKQAYCLAAALIEEGVAGLTQYVHYAEDNDD